MKVPAFVVVAVLGSALAIQGWILKEVVTLKERLAAIDAKISFVVTGKK